MDGWMDGAIRGFFFHWVLLLIAEGSKSALVVLKLQGRFLYKCVLLREGHLRVFSNLRRMHKYRNLPFHKQLSFYFLASFPFHRKEIFPWGSSPGIMP
jgi:hypothetical protein